MQSSLLIALQVGGIPAHMDQARELVKLIVEIEPEFRHDIEFALCVSKGVNKPYCADVLEIASHRFKPILVRSKRAGTGWPMGCNDLWQCCMSQLHALARAGKVKSDGVLTFEPDCVMLRPDWLDALKGEWQRAKEARKLVVGHMQGDPPTHINGNAIFHINIVGLHPVLGGCDAMAGWDVYHAPLLLRLGMSTPHIFQLYRTYDMPTARLERIKKQDIRPAIFHGIKDMSGINGVREMIRSGEFDGRRREVKPKLRPIFRIIQKSDPKFSISILALNKLEITKACITSVLKNSEDYELLLWDNGSNDGTSKYFQDLERKHSNIHATIHKENIGFIEPNKKHLEKAKGKYFVLLNNDTTVPIGWLEELEVPFTKNPKAAISGPSETCCELSNTFHGRPGKNIEYIEGSCLCAPVELLRKHGLFSDYIQFAYGEDCDLSLRMRELGYTIHHANTQVNHMRSVTSRDVPGIREIQQKNLKALQKRWGHYIKVRKMDHPILIRRQGSLGDVLLTTPIVRELRRQRPLSRIIVETSCPDIYRDNPNINAVRQAGDASEDMLVFDLNMAYENRPMVNYLEAYEQASGIEVHGDRRPEIFPRWLERNFVTGRMDNGKKWCAIHAGPSWPCRIWPSERWQTVSEWLQTQGYKVLLVGQSQETITSNLDTRNSTTIHHLAAIMKQCQLFIGIDSFPFHCAVAAGISAVGLFGISYSHIVIPKGTSGIGIDADPSHPFSGARSRATGATKISCPDNPLLTISVEQVIEKLKQILP